MTGSRKQGADVSPRYAHGVAVVITLVFELSGIIGKPGCEHGKHQFPQLPGVFPFWISSSLKFTQGQSLLRSASLLPAALPFVNGCPRTPQFPKGHQEGVLEMP